MTTLDQILTQRIIEEHKDAMTQTLDLTTWNAENRDERLGAARELGHRIAERGVELVAETLSREVEGKPLFYLILLTSVIMGELELLYSMREEFDVVPDEDLESYPVSPAWLTEKIRERIQELASMHAMVTAGLSTETEVEEV